MKTLAILAGLATLTMLRTPADAAPAAKDTVVLQRAAVPGTNRQLGLGLSVFPPNGQKPWHKATGPELLYVLAGSLIVQMDGQPPAVLHAGESFCIPADARHLTTAGPRGAKVLASWVWVPGGVFNIPASK